MGKYVSAPVASTKMPGGIPYIIGNELAERFSFYGMRGILTVFMTKHLLDSSGQPDYMNEEDAKAVYHLFTAAAYFFPIVGSLISDICWGKYRTIIVLSLGYCIGHALLAMGDTGIGIGLMEPRMWLFAGLIFIAVGAGGIKPCVSAHVGDQFGKENQHLVSKMFSWFYFAINVGAMTSTLLTPVLLERVGPGLAFGTPGVLMALATLFFWLGRHRFVHIPAAGWTRFKDETLSQDGLRAVLNLSPIFLIFIPMFWAIFDQTGSAWVIQASYLNRHFLGIHWLESQIQAVNPFLILVLIPTFSYGVYPLVDKVFTMTPLRKISIGLFLTAIAFSVSAIIEQNITGGQVTDMSSVSPDRAWTGLKLIDGNVDGFGWSTEETEFPHEIVIRLRERVVWPITSVELNPYALVGGDGTDAGEPDPDSWARRVTVLALNADLQTADAKGFREVGSIELRQENALQSIGFDEVQATHVMLRIDSNWGGDHVKLGRVRVLTSQATTPATASRRAEIWPDVAGMGSLPSIGWQFFAYILLTAAEVMVSITALEFAYTQAPKKMKSFIMGIYFLGVSLGNLFTSAVNLFIQNEDGSLKLEGASYYWFFTGLMFITAVIFVFVAMVYKGRRYAQGED